MQYWPLVLTLSFFGILLGVRGLRFRRRYGYAPYRVPRWRDGVAAAILSYMLVAALAAVLLLAIVATIAPGRLEQFDPLYRSPGPALMIAGTTLMLLGSALVWRAQEDMREAWRVGMNAGERTPLVTEGLFQFCRNPIYLGLQVAIVGFVALVPGSYSLALLAIFLVLFQAQCRQEESHLLRQHGRTYPDYCRRVGRFLPWTGRLTFPAAGRHSNETER